MRIGIMSDTHGRHELVARALEELRRRQVSLVIHCGDIHDEATVLLFQGFTSHFVLGNCDRPARPQLERAMEQVGAVLHEPFGELNLDGVKVGFLHGDNSRLLRKLEQSGRYQYLFTGHTHQAEERAVGPTRVINPGALARAWPKLLVVLDLATGEAESVGLD